MQVLLPAGVDCSSAVSWNLRLCTAGAAEGGARRAQRASAEERRTAAEVLPGGRDGVERPEMLYPAGGVAGVGKCRHDRPCCRISHPCAGKESRLVQLNITALASAAGRVLWLIPQDEPAVVADDVAADAAAEEVSFCRHTLTAMSCLQRC
jgi:hypothetical protein